MLVDQDFRLLGVGLAMPGPFEYDVGICRIQDLNKYDSLYGLNIRTELKWRLGLPAETPVIFRNDASCFLLGELWRGAAVGHKAAIGLTLGTGFGSSFVRRGRLIEEGPDVPKDGFLYHLPWRDRIADDWFSARGLLRRYRELGGERAENVRQLAERVPDDPAARRAFEDFGAELADFLLPWIKTFKPEVIVTGGNIAKAWRYFETVLVGQIRADAPLVEVKPARLFEDAALLGAGWLPLRFREPEQ